MQHSEKLPKLNAEAALDELARRNLLDFTKRLWPEFHATDFHTNYYHVLDAFCKGYIKKLIVTIPPQHGKSQGSSKFAPGYMFGLNPDLNIALMSYSTRFAQKFNKKLQRVIDSDEYRAIFPNTKISSDGNTKDERGFLRNADEFEIVNGQGNFKAIGREGSLTGNPVDIMVFDDLYKDAMEGNSPVIRANVIDMYKAVAETRYHNTTQELIVFTRWHEEDLIGYIQSNYNVITIESLSQLYEDYDWTNTWLKINFEALKESEPTEIDPREIGEPLYPQRHSKRRLEIKQANDPILFGCMYQGDPQPKEGLLYSDFATYSKLPNTIKKGNYTDTADLGDDYLCSICYEVGTDGKAYVIDIVYSQERMEETEKSVSMMLRRCQTKDPLVESNNGGRGFAISLQKILTNIRVNWFHQSKNKESRILTHASQVSSKIVMPSDWKQRWPQFANHVLTYKKIFKANKFHDAADTLTGIVETEFSTIHTGYSSATTVRTPDRI